MRDYDVLIENFKSTIRGELKLSKINILEALATMSLHIPSPRVLQKTDKNTPHPKIQC